MYRLFLLLFLISCQSENKKATKQPAPPIPVASQEVLHASDKAIHVRLGAKDALMIEGKQVSLDVLEPALRAAKKSKGDTATIVIHLKGSTNFGLFTAVHEKLEALLAEERDSVSLLRFGNHYEDLNATQQAIVKRKHHLRIIEKMQR